MTNFKIRLLALSSFGLFSLSAAAANDAHVVRGFDGSVVSNYSNECWQSFDKDDHNYIDCLIPKIVPVASQPTMPQPKAREALTAAPLPKVESIKGSVGFDTNDYELSRNDLSAFLARVPADKSAVREVIVRGYSDYTGTPKHNHELSLKRAEAAKRVLSNSGIAANKIRVVPMGDQESRILENCQGQVGAALESCLASDRRVDIEIPAFAR